MTTSTRKTVWVVMFLFIAGGAFSWMTRFAVSDDVKPKSPQRRAEKGSIDLQFRSAEDAPEAPPAIDWDRLVVLQGKVLGTGDRPVAGARFYLSANSWTDPIELGTSDAKGVYRFDVPEISFRQMMDDTPEPDVDAKLMVIAEGLGPAWMNLPAVKCDGWDIMKPEYAHDFRLAADCPIAGRIVDAGGMPVAGALIAVRCIDSLDEPCWAPILTAIRAGRPDLLDRAQSNPPFPPFWPSSHYRTAWNMCEPAISDVNGRFQITGVGRDWVIRLDVDGPGIRSTSIGVLTRDDVTDFTQSIRTRFPRTRHNGDSQEVAGVQFFSPSPTIEVESARTIGGIVRDAQTHAPIPNIRVTLAFGATRILNEYTDRQGRYRFVCSDNASSFWIYAASRNHDRYLPATRRFDSGPGLDTVADFDLQAGVIVSGRVVEAGTDRPIVSAPQFKCHANWPGFVRAGFVYYVPLSTNAVLRGTPTGQYFEGLPTDGAAGHSTAWNLSALIDGKGRFRLAVPPGPGVVLVQSSPGTPDLFPWTVWNESAGYHRLFPYVVLTSRTKDDGAPEGDPQILPGFAGPIHLVGGVRNYEAYHVINPSADATTMDLTLTIPRAPSRVLRFVNSDGREVRGVRVQGLVEVSPPFSMTVVFEGSEVEVLALVPGQPRDLFVISNDGKYTARVSVSTDDETPRTVRLESAGSISGRLVDADTNLPLSGYSATLIYPDDQSASPRPTGMWGGGVKTDETGRFVIRAVLPGTVASISFHQPSPGAGMAGREFHPESLQNLTVRPGKIRNLGDIPISLSRDVK